MALEFLKTIEIREPLIFLSDVLLAAACFYCYFNIKSKAGAFIRAGIFEILEEIFPVRRDIFFRWRAGSRAVCVFR